MKKNKNKLTSLRLSYEYVKHFVEYIYGNGKLKLLTKEYQNARTKLDIVDDIGYVYQVTFDNLQYFNNNNRELAKFSKSNKYTIDNIKIWMKDNARGYKILSSKYNGNRNKLKFECDNNHAFETTWVSFFNNGSRCPYCRSSRGEVKIRYYLEDSNIDFEEEYIFDDCKNIRPLPFDFAIFDNGRLELLIEFDGEQHFRAMSNFGGKEAFVYLQGNDEIKNSYCKKNNIELLRIPFKKIDSIEDILANKLNDMVYRLHNQDKKLIKIYS